MVSALRWEMSSADLIALGGKASASYEADILHTKTFSTILKCRLLASFSCTEHATVVTMGIVPSNDTTSFGGLKCRLLTSVFCRSTSAVLIMTRLYITPRE